MKQVLNTTMQSTGLGSTEAASISRWRPATRIELGILATYFVLVIAITDIVNVRAGVEVMTIVVVAAALFITRLPAAFARDWWFFLIGLLAWNLSGPIAAHSPFTPHLDFLLNTDRFLFFGRDPVVLAQTHLAPAHGSNALDVLTAIAYNLHLPEPYIAGYFLWRLDRAIYLQFAACVLILLVAGFVTFFLLPAVPPWMASTWFGRIHGVINRFGPTLRLNPLPFHGTPIFYVFKLTGDAVAAFPSEHAAFPLLELLAFSRVAGRAVVAALVLWVLWVLFSVVYLGEHWVTDALAGYVYALSIFWFVRWYTGRRSGARLARSA